MRSSEQVPCFPSSINLAAAGVMKNRILAASHAANTLLNYGSAWKSWGLWCAAVGAATMPATPALLIDYAAWCIAEGFRFETVLCRLKAVNFEHRKHSLPVPYDESVRDFLANARRHLCERPQGKAALTPGQLRKMSAAFRASGRLMDIRDCALVLLGFACGWRRAEIVSVDLSDVRWVDHGITLWLGKSKTDQSGRGRLVGIFRGEHEITCPIHGLEEWLSRRGRWPGPLFTQATGFGNLTEHRLDGAGVWRAVKRGMKLIGEDPGPYGAHSLRAGMVTASLEAGAHDTSVSSRTGQSYQTVRRYFRPATVFLADPLAGVL
jgi:integrase